MASSSTPRPTLLWLRQDLRLADHPALLASIDRGGPVIPVFILAPDEEGDWPAGGARRWWLHKSLGALANSLEKCGSRLIFRRGATRDALGDLIDETGADAVFWSRRYEPAVRDRDDELKEWLTEERDVEVQTFNSLLLHEPWDIETNSGTPYKVFTPFWKTAQKLPQPDLPRDAPDRIPAPGDWPDSLALDDLDLEPTRDWKDGLDEFWTPGEAAAHDQLDRFLDEGLVTYVDDRNTPGKVGTSRLSPHLHHGELSPRQVFHAVRRYLDDGRRNIDKDDRKQADQFVTEIGWREFAYHVLYHFPHTPEQPLRDKYADFPWAKDKDQLRRWQKGQTGYPIIDAGMRQLYAIGWMHNRVRMIVASFLVKDLLISWQEGERWFWDTLVDADLANNTLGWQWAGGCGADPAPFFRIFNPTSQGEKFDPHGKYVRHWVPELEDLPDKWLFRPVDAPADVLEAAGIELGKDYPKPIVNHKDARHAALEALETVKS